MLSNDKSCLARNLCEFCQSHKVNVGILSKNGSFLEVKISGATWIFPDGRFEKMKSIAIGEGTNATEREENQVSWNLFHLSLSYLNAAKKK